MTLKTRSHFALVCFIFVPSIIYFVYNGSWYAPATLEINGTISKLLTGFDITWDSGAGFNSYETYRAVLETPANTLSQKQEIKIRNLGKKNGASISKTVVIDGILIDGDNILEGRIKLSEKQPEKTFQVAAEKQISISLETNNHSGFVGIGVNGVTIEKDLYVANVEAKSRTFDYWLVSDENEFTVSAKLPRYPIKELALVKRKDGKSIKLNSVTLITDEKRVSLLEQPQYLTTTSFKGISNYQKRFFDWNRFFQQLLFGALTTWLISALLRLYFRLGGLSKILSRQERIFIALFCGVFLCYLIWLLIFWPGVFSVDSLKIWRAAQLPEVYLNDHPILNVFLYTYLFHIWNNSAIVPLFHITVMSALVSWIFYTLNQHGVSLKLLLPFYLYAVLSIPIGLYNLMLWKDVPFAILAVFWAFLAAVLFYKRRSGTLNLSSEQMAALIMLLLALSFIRHNGLVYLVFIPILLLITGIIKFSMRTWLVTGALLLFSIGALTVIAYSPATDAGYLVIQGKIYLQRFFHNTPAELWQRTWNNYWGVLDINQQASKWDLFHFYLKDRYDYGFLQHAGWQDVYPYLQKWTGPLAGLKDQAMQLYLASYTIPLVYLSWNPVWALALLPMSIVLCRWLPMSAMFSSVILIQIFTLVTVLNIMNWRYYYFACLAGCFMIPLIYFDIARIRRREKSHEF